MKSGLPKPRLLVCLLAMMGAAALSGIASAAGHSLVTRDRDFAEVASTVGLVLETY